MIKTSLFDLSHPFFAPLWRRILLSTALICWSIWEFAMGEPFWGVLVLAIGIWTVWGFFLSGTHSNGNDASSDSD